MRPDVVLNLSQIRPIFTNTMLTGGSPYCTINISRMNEENLHMQWMPLVETLSTQHSMMQGAKPSNYNFPTESLLCHRRKIVVAWFLRPAHHRMLPCSKDFFQPVASTAYVNSLSFIRLIFIVQYGEPPVSIVFVNIGLVCDRFNTTSGRIEDVFGFG